ncbi:MAG: pitrilysin family protein [Micropepsaceae bacterium]
MASVRILGLALVVALTVAIGWTVPLAAPSAGESAAVSVPRLSYTTRQLKNGLKIYLLQDRSTPNVTVQMWYQVGSKHDPEGRSGFAHLFEHILSRKTRNMPLNMVNQLTEDVGGVRNASTGDDRTNYFEIVPAAYLETMLWTHAERMARPVVDSAVFETERGVVKEELRQRYLAPPYGRFFGFMMPEQCYDTLPNRRPGIGNIDELNSATLEDARSFHEAFYGPDTASLVVSGNFDQARVDQLIDKYFAPIPKRKYPASLAIDATQAPRQGARAVTMYAPNVPLPAVASVWPLPSINHADTPALMVLDAILARGESSRLKRSLVNGSGVATDAASYDEHQEDGGCLATWAMVASGKTVEEAEGALRAEIVRLRDQGVTSDELAEAKIELLSEDLRQRETFAGRAFLLGEALVSTGDPKWPDKLLAAIQNLSPADIQRAARTYLSDASRVDVRYLDEAKRPAGEADNWRNPLAMPKFKPLPNAKATPNEVAPEAERQAPPAPSADVPVVPPAIAERTLPNGMKVIAAKTGDVPFAALTLVVGGGTSTDPADQAGLATLTAQVMVKGTATRSADQIAVGIESLGATINPQASADGASMSVVAPLATLDGAAGVLADVARNASFPQAEFERERSRSLDGWSVTLKDPGALAGLASQRLMYGAAPYGSPAGGVEASLKRLTRDDLARAHEAYWRPENATLVVTGGVEQAEAFALATRVFGDWQAKGQGGALPIGRAGTAERVQTVVIDLPGAGQAAVVASLRALKRSDPDYYALAAANAVLGAGSNGRLFQEIRVKRALSYGSYSSLPQRLDVAVISAAAQTKNESAADVAKVMLGELDRLKNEPLTEVAVGKRKTFLTGGFNRQVQTAGGLGGTIAGFALQGMPAGEAVAFNGKLAAVTAEAASSAARRYAGAEQATLVVVGDAAKFLKALKAVRPNLEVIKIDDLDLESPTLRRK